MGADGSSQFEQNFATTDKTAVVGTRVAASPHNLIVNKQTRHAAITLSNGITMPLIGLGTWHLEGDNCQDIVYEAIVAGYRFIDTAEAYQNEKEVSFSGLTIFDTLSLVT